MYNKSPVVSWAGALRKIIGHGACERVVGWTRGRVEIGSHLKRENVGDHMRDLVANKFKKLVRSRRIDTNDWA